MPSFGGTEMIQKKPELINASNVEAQILSRMEETDMVAKIITAKNVKPKSASAKSPIHKRTDQERTSFMP